MESPSYDRIQAQLEKLLQHPHFSNKQQLSEFLRFVVINTLNGDLARLKETVIGVEVCRRDPSYNPKENPIVRTEARRLRALLEQHYEEEGRDDEVLISIPKGSYVAQFAWRRQQEETPEEIADAETPVEAVVTVRRWRWRLPGARITLLAGLLCVCLIGTAAYTFVNTKSANTVWSAQPFSRLHGVEGFASFSPDGTKVAFVWSGPQDTEAKLYWQDLMGSSPTQLTSGGGEDNRPAWSPDGELIAFLRLRAAGKKDVMLLSMKTGRQTKVAELEGANPWLCIIPRLSWSNDGRYLFTSESFGAGEACGVVAIDLKTHGVRRVTQPPAGVLADVEPAVSPNGKQLAFLRNAGLLGGDLYVMSVGGGTPQRVTFDNRDIVGFSWSADGRSLIAASRRGDGVLRLWQMGGELRKPRQLTDGSMALGFPVASPRGDRIAFTAYRNITSIWQVNEGGRKQLTFEEASDSNPQLSPDGSRLVFRSDRSGSFEIWTSDRDGGNSRRITRFNGPIVGNPVWAPNGRRIAFECRPQGDSDVCLMAGDGRGEIRRFTQWESSEGLPSWSRDGRSIYFSSNRSGRWEIYRQGVDGGEAVQITHHGGMRAIESWDGRELYVHRGPPAGGMLRLHLPGDGSLEELAHNRLARCGQVRRGPLLSGAASSGLCASEELRSATDSRTAPKSAEVSLSVAGAESRPALAFEEEINEQNVLPGQLGGSEIGAWDVGPGGPIFLVKKTTDRQVIDAYDTASGECRTLFTLANRTPDGDGIFSVTPDGKSFLYVAEKAHEARIGMLVPER